VRFAVAQEHPRLIEPKRESSGRDAQWDGTPAAPLAAVTVWEQSCYRAGKPEVRFAVAQGPPHSIEPEIEIWQQNDQAAYWFPHDISSLAPAELRRRSMRSDIFLFSPLVSRSFDY
jgi:hypothetical protein